MSKQEIQASGPLQEMPQEGEYIICDYEGDVMPIYWSSITAYMIEAGRIYPGTEAGRLGAELRAKQGILPPADREEHGVFVPESLIKDFARATENAWIDGDFKDCYHEVENFLKAIEKGGQNE